MTKEEKEQVFTHLYGAMSALYQDNCAPAMDAIREALKLLDNIEALNEVRITIRADIGDTIQQINECTKACNALIIATKRLDKTFSEE